MIRISEQHTHTHTPKKRNKEKKEKNVKEKSGSRGPNKISHKILKEIQTTDHMHNTHILMGSHMYRMEWFVFFYFDLSSHAHTHFFHPLISRVSINVPMGTVHRTNRFRWLGDMKPFKIHFYTISS